MAICIYTLAVYHDIPPCVVRMLPARPRRLHVTLPMCEAANVVVYTLGVWQYPPEYTV